MQCYLVFRYQLALQILLLRKITCLIVNDDQLGNAKINNMDETCTTSAENTQACQILNSDTFNHESPSIIFAEPKGRFGNQLLGYLNLYQLQAQIGVKSYITRKTKDYLLNFFTPESIILPVFNKTFCNWRSIEFTPFNGHFVGKNFEIIISYANKFPK